MLEILGGKITIDGLDLSPCPREVVHSASITMPQDSVLFKGSIRFNFNTQGLVDEDTTNQNTGFAALMYYVHLSDG